MRPTELRRVTASTRRCRGSPLTVNGRTTDVTGDVVVAESKLAKANFTIDVGSITSPESARDGQFRGEDILDVAKFPTAEFKATQPADLAAVPESGAAVTVDLPGTMTIKGTARDVTAKVNVKRAGDTVIAAASVPVTWTDFGVTPPDFAGFVTVRADGHHRDAGEPGQE